MNRIWRFFGTIILAYLFSIIWNMVCITGWVSIVWLITDFSIINFILFSLASGIAFHVLTFILVGLGVGLAHLVKSSKIIATPAILIFLMYIINNIASLFFIADSSKMHYTYELYEMLNGISGIWYNIGAVCTLGVLILGFVLATISMFSIEQD